MPSAVKKRAIPPDSDQEMEDVEEVQDQGSGDEQAGDGDAEPAEEEYEIERILDAKSGAFAEGRIGYLVKWKGYSSAHNSWVSEQDAGNAKDLIDDFWRRSRKEKKGRKSEGKQLPPPPKGQKSISARAQSSDVESAPQKKRGRPSKATALTISDDEEEEEVPKPKKAKQVAKRPSVTSSARKPKAKEAEPDEEMEEDEEVFSDIKKLKNLEDWSPFVERIDTIERTGDGTLFVYFLLNTKGKGKVGDSTHRCRERSDICRQKMPQRLLDFYEENLRWRKIDGENE